MGATGRGHRHRPAARPTAAALAPPGALAAYAAFHTASLDARVLLGVVALHLLVGSLGYVVVLLLEALAPCQRR